MMLPRAHVSATQLSMYLRCPASYYFRYVRGINISAKPSLTKGKAVHAGIEYNYRQKLVSRQDLPLREVAEYTAAKFEALEAGTDFAGSDPDHEKDNTIALVSLYHTAIAPLIQPMAVEEEVLIHLSGSLAQLKGYIKLVDKQGFIRETKTTARTPAEEEAFKSLQLSFYALAYRTSRGREEAGLTLDYLVATKVPKVVRMATRRTAADMARFEHVARLVLDAIENERYYPNPSCILCSPKGCGYWDVCHQTF